jgi:hypothetical protein
VGRPLLALLFAVSLSAQAPQVRPTQADGVVRLLSDLESALAANNVDELIRLTATTLPTAEMAAFVNVSFGDGQTSAAVRERDRRPSGTGYAVLADVLIGRGKTGRIATWQLLVQPRTDDPARFEIAGASSLAAVDGLVKLDLDATQQFAARDLVFRSPGLTLRMASGAVFLARVDGGATALIFRGRGEMIFAPADPAEQVQIRAFSGQPAIETPVEVAYLRLNPADFAEHLSSAHLVPVATNPGDLARARSLFDEFNRRSYTLDLGDLTAERWSLLPPSGDVLTELRTRRFGTLTYVRSPGDEEDISLFDRARGRNISVYASPERLATRGRYYSEDDGAAYDVQHYSAEVRFDPERAWISGRGSIRLTTRREEVSSLSIKLAESFAVTSISSPSFGRVLALRVSGQSGILVGLPRSLPRGTELILDVFYSGRLPPQSIDREAMEVSQQPQQIPEPLDRPIQPEPRYLYSNRAYWYPQAPSTDYATAALQLTVPAQFQIVASGSLVSSVVTPVPEGTNRSGDARAERTVRFLADRPLRYLACVISRFVPVGRAQAAVPGVAATHLSALGATPATATVVNIDVVSTPRLMRANRALPERAAQMMEYFATTIGEAPYPDFSLAVLDAELPSGHSPAYFGLWNQPTLPTNLSWRDDPVALNGHPFFFLAHEVAHQWFGQAIGWKNYHEQWLSEGLAQYFAVMYAGHDRGPDTERAMFVQMRASALDLSRHGPLDFGYRLGHIQSDGRIFRGLVYNKSAVVLHMLRRLIGDASFQRGIQRFYRTHRFQKAGTGDLRAAFEAETPLPLQRFFDRWVHGFTIPEIRLTWRMDTAGEVTVKVEQLGETFDFPLVLTLQYADGSTEQRAVAVGLPAHEFRLPVPSAVRRVDTRDDLGLVLVKR